MKLLLDDKIAYGHIRAKRRGSTRRVRRLILVLSDLFLIWCSAAAVLLIRYGIRQYGHSRLAQLSDTYGHIGFLVLYSGLIVLFCNTQYLYKTYQTDSAREEVKRLAKAFAMATGFQMGCIYLSGLKVISRLVIGLTMVLSFASVAGFRYIRRHRIRNGDADGIHCRNALIVGTDSSARGLHDSLRANRLYGYVVKGVLVRNQSDFLGVAAHDVLGSVQDFRAIIRSHFIDEVIISDPDREFVKQIAKEAQSCGLGVRVIPDLYDGLGWGAPIEYLGQYPTMSLHQRTIPAVSLMLKRSLDVSLSAAALIFSLPLFLFIAAAIKLDSNGPIFYISARMGMKGRTFRCYKFRTMVAEAERLKVQLSRMNERDGILFKITNDPRITRVGRILRKYSLDELPQLWNVFTGDMSLVGPRPPLMDEVEQYQIDHLRRLDVLPGVTGLWQVEGRSNPCFEDYIALDVQYLENWSLLLDLRILLKTVVVVLAGTGR